MHFEGVIFENISLLFHLSNLFSALYHADIPPTSTTFAQTTKNIAPMEPNEQENQQPATAPTITLTDTDFIQPMPTQGDWYDLLYGSMRQWGTRSAQKAACVYNLVVTLCRKQQAKPMQKVYAQTSLKNLAPIVQRLETYAKQPQIYDQIRIPFISYRETVAETLRLFQSIRETLDYLLANDFQDLALLEINEAKLLYPLYPVPTMQTLFKKLQELYREAMEDIYHDAEGHSIADEAVRRGLFPEYMASPEYSTNLYLRYLIRRNDEPLAETPSAPEDDAPAENPACIPAKNRIGVLYYMLHGKIDDELLVKVANFVTGKDYDPKKRANNSAYKYIHHPQHFTAKQDQIDYIRTQLEKYGIEVPKELK